MHSYCKQESARVCDSAPNRETNEKADASQPSKRKSMEDFSHAEVIIGSGSMIFNSMVLFAIWYDPKLRNITNCFVGNLALSDTMLGIFILSVHSFFENHDAIITVIITLKLIITEVEKLSLLSIGLERFFAIR